MPDRMRELDALVAGWRAPKRQGGRDRRPMSIKRRERLEAEAARMLAANAALPWRGRRAAQMKALLAQGGAPR